MITIYGIKNCDKCRAAQKWFGNQGASFVFHDIRLDGLTDGLYKSWQAHAGDGALLNRRSQTWRKIPESDREKLNAGKERKLALRYPTVVKRPVVMSGNMVCIGYDESAWKKFL